MEWVIKLITLYTLLYNVQFTQSVLGYCDFLRCLHVSYCYDVNLFVFFQTWACPHIWRPCWRVEGICWPLGAAQEILASVSLRTHVSVVHMKQRETNVSQIQSYICILHICILHSVYSVYICYSLMFQQRVTKKSTDWQEIIQIHAVSGVTQQRDLYICQVN